MTTLKNTLVSATGIALLGFGMAVSAATLTFDGLPAGAITAPIPGVTISATDGIGEAWLYNTDVAGEDLDLGGAFTTGINGSPDPEPFGNVLIVQENNGPAPDDNGGGGTLMLSFDEAVTMLSMDVLDMKVGSKIQLFSDASFTNQIGSDFILGDADTGNDPTNNLYERVMFGNDGTAGVQSLKVFLEASGGIDNVSYVPLPAAAWLFGSALLGLVTASRRRKALV